MEIYWDIDNIFQKTPTVLTVGTFDGVHLGHQAILKKLVASADSLGAASTLITFEPHPQFIVPREQRNSIQLLSTIEEKISYLSQTGLSRLVVTSFTPAFAAMTAEDFVSEILLDKLHMQKIIVGHDHSFGKDRLGNFELLRQLGLKYHFQVETVPPVYNGSEIISSTKLRQYLLEGHLDQVQKCLGRDYSVEGQIVKGDQRGHDLGFPTANLKPHSQYKLVPKIGVYASRAIIEGGSFPSVTYIGPRPTFNMSHKVIEVHIPRFNRNLYGVDMEVQLVKFIRDDARFDTVPELVKQIERDVVQSMELLKAQ